MVGIDFTMLSESNTLLKQTLKTNNTADRPRAPAAWRLSDHEDAQAVGRRVDKEELPGEGPPHCHDARFHD